MAKRDLLLDVSRLIWRVWSGRLPTGIDRVCHAYMEHYGPRALAVIQSRKLRIVLSASHSGRLFALLAKGSHRGFRRKLVALLAGAMLFPSPRPQTRGMVYLNVGHTGLDAPDLSAWLASQGWHPFFMVHDLIPISHPEFCRSGEAQRHRLRMRTVVESATGVIVNSSATGDAFSAFAAGLGRASPPLLVNWLATDGKTGALATRANASRPTFLMIGTIEARKNHMTMLRLWERLVADMQDEAPQLVLVGQRGWKADDVFAVLDSSAALRGHVRELNSCDDAQLRTWLESSRALLMPSFVEGFGIPVIEAMEAGVPVIVSDQAVFREIAGDIPLYLDPHDEQAWEAAIRSYSSDCPDRNRQLSALAAYRRFSWDDHFAAITPWIERLLRCGDDKTPDQ
jgi:hypothetical protein